MNAVIFDMDGVLILTEDAHFQSWRATAARHGVDVDHATFIRSFGRTNPDIIRLWWKDAATPSFIASVADEKERAFRDIIRHDVPLAPRCAELLHELKDAGFRLAVGSSAPRENIDLVLESAGLRGCFEGIVDGSMVKRGKPAPDVFLLAAEQLGMPPARCAVIEDAPAGITAAVAAGTCAVGVAATHPAAELTSAGARVVTPTLADLTATEISRQLTIFGA